MAAAGNFSRPPLGVFVAAYGEILMAADRRGRLVDGAESCVRWTYGLGRRAAATVTARTGSASAQTQVSRRYAGRSTAPRT